MCLIAVAFGASAHYPLIVAANRDEYHRRPASPAHWWQGRPRILAGRDLEAGGTWLGIDDRGRFAAVTNVWEPGNRYRRAELSRGHLVSAYLQAELPAGEYRAVVAPQRARYGPFNLLLYDGRSMHYLSNRSAARALDPGVHVLSNGEPEADWPKILHARSRLQASLTSEDPADALLDLLATRRAPGGGVAGDPSPRNSLFVVGPDFGTRCSTVILGSADGRMTFIERRFDVNGELTGETHVISDGQSFT